jgi:hypothetical protein
MNSMWREKWGFNSGFQLVISLDLWQFVKALPLSLQKIIGLVFLWEKILNIMRNFCENKIC